MLRVVGASCGILLAALLGAAYVLGGPMPHAGTPPAELVAFLNAHSGTQEWSWFLSSGPALLVGPWFLGVLTAYLWESNRPQRQLTAAAFSSGLVTAALLATASILWGLFVYLGTQITAPSLILVLAEARHFAEGSVGFPAAGAVIGFTLAARGHLPAWSALGLLGAGAATLQLANAVDDFVVDGVTGALGPASLALLLTWLAATSFSLTAAIWPERQRRSSARSAAVPAGLSASSPSR